ncbi:MAG: holo-ACP synthase [Clostridia bacterium]|nr:holo-ACP synthase [Clostridia bacterium]
MAILCGVDIIEIQRIRKSIESTGGAFKGRVYTDREILYCESRKVVKYQSYAARFAAKEAVSKAFGTGIGKGIELKDIEILNDDYGKPYVILKGKARQIYNELGGQEISLSISHCHEYAVAYVIVQTP